jgi:hypothetical protein
MRTLEKNALGAVLTFVLNATVLQTLAQAHAFPVILLLP